MLDLTYGIMELECYYAAARRVGHTHAMLNGAKNTNAFIVVANKMQAEQFEFDGFPKERILTIYELDKLRGREFVPLLFDNYAIISITSGIRHENKKLIDENHKLIEENRRIIAHNEELKEEIDRLKRMNEVLQNNIEVLIEELDSIDEREEEQ